MTSWISEVEVLPKVESLKDRIQLADKKEEQKISEEFCVCKLGDLGAFSRTQFLF